MSPNKKGKNDQQPLTADALRFWESDLQMCLDPWLAKVQRRAAVKAWIDQLTKRQVRVLHDNLGLNGDGTLTEQRNALLANRQRVIPYYFVDRFAYRRHRFATTSYARAVLTPPVLAQCGSDEEAFDIPALLFALHQVDPAHLTAVFHLEKIHLHGFARMKLKKKPRAPKNRTFQKFLTATAVDSVLADFDRRQRDGRNSELKDVLPWDGRCIAFIRREERRRMVLKSRGAFHGFAPEWIILSFSKDAGRVDISSLSRSIPLEIANRLASKYFGSACEYVNEVEVTPRQLIVQFFDALRKDQCPFAKLAEVTVKNSPLEGAASLRLNGSNSQPIGLSVRHFEKSIGAILSDVDEIASIKVLYRAKRVKLTFDSADGTVDGFVVRYVDRTLNAEERKQFEKTLRKPPYGLRVLTTSKQQKRR